MICGHAHAKDPKYDAIIMRILNRIVDHYMSQWTPPQVWDDLVQWLARCHNKVADGLADLAVDKRGTVHKVFDTSLSMSECNVVAQTDGGVRSDDCAAAAWIIGLWGKKEEEYVYELWIAHGTFLDCKCTFFFRGSDSVGRSVSGSCSTHA